MTNKLNGYVAAYKTQLENGDIQIAYEQLIKFVMKVKACFEKTFPTQYTYGNVSPGYLDFTYFPFSDTFLRNKKLRYGIVLNHRQMRFELWLMGRNAKIQKQYWALLKSSKWNADQPTMPQYSVLEVVLVDTPDFDDLDELAAQIVRNANIFAEEITQYIKSIE